LTALCQNDSLNHRQINFNEFKRIDPADRIPEDSILIFFNNKFYRANEIDAYNKTVDGVKIESLLIIKNKDSIHRILNSKIKALIIINDKKKVD
jgi:hypothetical protein